MVKKPFSFNFDANAHAIVEALRRALEDIMPDIMADNNLQERNGYGQFRWNVIIAQLKDSCRHLGWFDMGTCKRGAWKTPVLFHLTTHSIITLMTEGTFADVQQRKEKGKHYLWGGASFNHDAHPQTEQIQMDLPPVETTNQQKWIAKSRKQLAEALQLNEMDISGHILVLFEVRNDRLLSVRAVRLTNNLEISTEEEDWSNYIRTPFNASQIIEPQQNNDDEGESLVELL